MRVSLLCVVSKLLNLKYLRANLIKHSTNERKVSCFDTGKLELSSQTNISRIIFVFIETHFTTILVS